MTHAGYKPEEWGESKIKSTQETPIKSDKCKSFKTYKGLYKPRCNGGKGCKYCWDLYNKVQQFITQTKKEYGEEA